MSPSQPRDDLPGALAEDDYDRLPVPIQQGYTRAEYLWLSDAQKQTLIDQECEPEW